MNTREYLELSAKTDAPIDNAAQIRACDVLDLDHVADGLVTEAGEFKDVLKKYKFYAKELDYINLIEEMGDILWYLAKGCRELGVTMEEVMEVNINKLKRRYGEKFSEGKAIKRNLPAERKILEGQERKKLADDECESWFSVAFEDALLGEWKL